MYKVLKRDGSIVLFDITKITSAIEEAFKSVGKAYDSTQIDMLALIVTSRFDKKLVENKISVEDIQDIVEQVLMEAGYSDDAKSYILYRKNH